MREQFRVDLRGIVDVIGHHLYSSERVYLRELVQNARDAVTARAELGHDVDGLIEIEPAWGPDGPPAAPRPPWALGNPA